MLACVMALLLARGGRRRIAAADRRRHGDEAAALYYVRYVPRMPRSTAWTYGCGDRRTCPPLLRLERLLWGSTRSPASEKATTGSTCRRSPARRFVHGAPLAVEKRSSFNDEDRIGWSLVPFALFAGLLANSGHLLIALIVPDRRAGRNLAAAVTLALHSLFPDGHAARSDRLHRGGPRRCAQLSSASSSSATVFPLTGSRHSGAISASGASTNRRSRKRGCGTQPGLGNHGVPRMRSRSSVRGAPP